jgi:hypothetical protein
MHRKAEEEGALVLGVDRRQRSEAPPGRREPDQPICAASKAAVKRIRNRLSAEMRRLRGSNAPAVLAKISPIVRGWAAYSRTCIVRRGLLAPDAQECARPVLRGPRHSNASGLPGSAAPRMVLRLRQPEDHQEPRSRVSPPRRRHPNPGTSPQTGTTPGPWLRYGFGSSRDDARVWDRGKLPDPCRLRLVTRPLPVPHRRRIAGTTGRSPHGPGHTRSPPAGRGPSG